MKIAVKIDEAREEKRDLPNEGREVCAWFAEACKTGRKRRTRFERPSEKKRRKIPEDKDRSKNRNHDYKR